jgi:hypothetical protein
VKGEASQEQWYEWEEAWKYKRAVDCRKKRDEYVDCVRTGNKHYT